MYTCNEFEYWATDKKWIVSTSLKIQKREIPRKEDNGKRSTWRRSLTTA